MSGKLQQKNISDSFNLIADKRLELALLIGAGALAIVLHKVLRWPLDMPGRHGLEFMAIFAFLRLASQQKWAATIASIGAMTALTLFSTNPIGIIILLAQGVLLDLLYNHLTWQGRIVILVPFFTAVAHMLKPLLKALAQTNLGVFSDSLSMGLVTPLLSHGLFGFVGGVFGLLAWKTYQRTRSHFKA
ncbi:MAG: hypothetical protein P1P93_06865 [Gammaproteobacteria bacterium]|nr:hypothetical protein [Gammaproteobacteria bacterium]